MKQFKCAITYGTYDLFHIGHLNLLERIAQLADEVIVAVSTDEFNALKGKRTVIPYPERARIVAALRVVDQVIPEMNWEQKTDDVLKYQCDLMVMGDDWLGRFDFLKQYCEVLYLPRTEGISTTIIRETMPVKNG
ncbi:MAG: adenylyltransferase/cytidyltransferase family protein [Fibrobacteraceae bacterium]|nr:adenylyltransferase/cytidyltransferase family protein [Fibrobacteraceae bacterium]